MQIYSGQCVPTFIRIDWVLQKIWQKTFWCVFPVHSVKTWQCFAAGDCQQSWFSNHHCYHHHFIWIIPHGMIRTENKYLKNWNKNKKNALITRSQSVPQYISITWLQTTSNSLHKIFHGHYAQVYTDYANWKKPIFCHVVQS